MTQSAYRASLFLVPALAFGGGCKPRQFHEGSETAAAAECTSSSESVRSMAMIRGLCGCPNGAASCDRTFSNQSGYVSAGQPGCSDTQSAELQQNGAWKPAIANDAGNSKNWGGGGTAAGGGHEGWDFLMPNGTEIRAVGAGEVVYVLKSCNPGDNFCGNAWGNHVVIHHGGKTYTRYAHMSKEISVAIGNSVEAGKVLGKIGSTGASDAPHLHYELINAPTGWFPTSNPRNGVCVANPAKMRYDGGSSSGGVDMTALRARAAGKKCKVSPTTNGRPDQVAILRDANGVQVATLTKADEVKVRGWVDGSKASVEAKAGGRDFGAHVGPPAFLHESQIDLNSCH